MNETPFTPLLWEKDCFLVVKKVVKKGEIRGNDRIFDRENQLRRGMVHSKGHLLVGLRTKFQVKRSKGKV